MYVLFLNLQRRWFVLLSLLLSAHRNTSAATTPSPAVAPSSADSPRWWAGDPVVSNGRRGSWRGVSPRGYRVSIPALARTDWNGSGKENFLPGSDSLLISQWLTMNCSFCKIEFELWIVTKYIPFAREDISMELYLFSNPDLHFVPLIEYIS